MKFEELKTKTKDQLIKMLMDLKKDQMEKRFQLASGQLENTAETRKLRRQVARIQTALNAPADMKETNKAAPKKAAAKKTKAA
jgi:large subunit ribosomal protein L29